jgi:hypothetical protein
VSTRIDASVSRVQLLGALPSAWAQSIVTSPTRHELEHDADAVFSVLQRVLRDDGTLWLFCSGQQLPEMLERSGWQRQAVDWATPLMVDPAGRARLYLFTKAPEFHYSARTAELFMDTRVRKVFRRRRGRQRSCVWSPEHRDELTRLCVLAGSSRLACGTCGAAYERGLQGDARATCGHRDGSGRCVILDPFHHPGAHAREVAERCGRTFIGLSGAER